MAPCSCFINLVFLVFFGELCAVCSGQMLCTRPKPFNGISAAYAYVGIWTVDS